MAFVKVPHRSNRDTGGTGSHDTNVASTASSGCKECSLGAHLVLHHQRVLDQESSTLQSYVRVHQFFSRNSLVARSAGLSTPGQWDHFFFEVSVWISLMRLEMKAFQQERTPLIQDRAIIESVQQMNSTSSGSLRASLRNFTKLTLNRQPSNSRRGNVVCLRVATLCLAMTKDDTIELS